MKSIQRMENIKIILLLFILFGALHPLKAQMVPSLIIDSTEMQFSEVSFPYWLKAGQSIKLGTFAKKVSILEFTINGTALEFSKVISLSNSQIVPANKAWKIEGIGLNKNDSTNTLTTYFLNGTSGNVSSSINNNIPVLFQSPKKFERSGTYYWTVPLGITNICIEVWGGGGGGYSTTGSIVPGSGGGGGYGYGCFKVTPGTKYTVTVGDGGNNASGGSSSFGNLISASGGEEQKNGLGGIGGSSTGGSIRITGENGGKGGSNALVNGGSGANGGYGGIGGSVNGSNGLFPGGGGASSRNIGGMGANGQVIIYW
jgi:hypothetical protein